MVFFQLALLGGYLYAHVLSRAAAPRVQALLHTTVVVAALLSLPITPSADWKPYAPGDPTWRIVGLLLASVGLPYFVVSTTSPLIQAWFSRMNPGVSPYGLYGLSNAGSLLALITYPIVFEQWLTRQAQARLWGWGLGCFAVSVAICAWYLFRLKRGDGRESERLDSSGPTPTSRLVLLWFALSACASVLLLAITNTMCQDVAVVPFLWVLPLSLYLLSFILCFDSPHWYSRRFFTFAMVAAAGVLCIALNIGHRWPLLMQVAAYSGALFVCCMVCHGELSRLKPAPHALTLFYLLIAAGGAAGGVFVAPIAPLAFTSYAELNWGLWTLSALLGRSTGAHRPASRSVDDAAPDGCLLAQVRQSWPSCSARPRGTAGATAFAKPATSTGCCESRSGSTPRRSCRCAACLTAAHSTGCS
jgi:hypothetical protein